jgi:hypothetical protein
VQLYRIAAATCGTFMLVLSGCSSHQQHGQGVPSASVNPETTTSLPPISNPLDVDKLQADPCKGLTAEQLAPYMGNIRRSSVSQHDNGPSCDWIAEDGHMANIYMNIYPKLAGVGGLYGSGALFPYFQRVAPVAGYPAVHSALSADGPQAGECETTVAVSDHGVFGVRASATEPSYPHYRDACVVTDALAAAAIGNLKNGGS